MASSLQPLFLPSKKSAGVESEVKEVPCIFCDCKPFLIDKTGNYQNVLKHLLDEHKFVISNFAGVADPPKYFDYWKKRFQSSDLTDICAVIRTNTGENDVELSEHYYLLSDKLPEDVAIRRQVKKTKLDAVLAQQELERADALSKRMCLFCRKFCTENRATLLNHMAYDHNFSVGRPDNLVYIDELLDILEDKLKRLLCLYCEKTFKDWQTLKEHMRKKQHKHINPKNSAYDKYYVVNYADTEVNEAAGDEPFTDLRDSDAEEVEWTDWQEDEESNLICLICTEARTDLHSVIEHMKEAHRFDFSKVTKGLGFYQQIKVINFLRKQVYVNACFVCGSKFQSRAELLSHLSSEDHDNNSIEQSRWDQPQYYFPTYENDQLLCALEDENCAVSTMDDYVVPEDLEPPDRLVLEALRDPELGNEVVADRSLITSITQ